MTTEADSTIDLERVKIEAETKRIEARMGVWKVLVGTGVVGVAAAFFPFAQQIATTYFQAQIEEIKQKAYLDTRRAELELEHHIKALDSSASYKEFLRNVSREERTKTLDERIVLVEYFVHLSETTDEAEKWDKFLEVLKSQRQDVLNAKRKAVELSNSPEATPQALALAEYEADALEKIAAVVVPQRQARVGIRADANFAELVDQLSSTDAAVRRQARSRLADYGVELVRPAMTELSNTPISYRKRLGLIVSLTEMMRANKSNRRQIAERLRPDDLENLVMAAVVDDRTMRIYAAEFLYDLGDPRAFDIALEVWDQTGSDNGRYNLVLAMKGSAPFLKKTDAERARRSLRNLLGQVGTKTDRLIHEAIGLLPS